MGVEGSLQFFIESSHDLKNIPAGMKVKISDKDKSDMRVFYFVFGQWDANAGNQLVSVLQGKTHLALIDNSGILHRSYTQYGDYSFIEKGTNATIPSECTLLFPFHDTKTIRLESYEHASQLFGRYISDQAVHKLWLAHRQITYCIWCDVLWIKMDGLSKKIKPAATHRYYESTLKALEKLDYEVLTDIWAEWYVVDREHAEQLIALTLERRDQLLRAAADAVIIND